MSMCIYAYLAGAGASHPLAAVRLLARPRLGVLLTVAIIASDVTLNGWVGVTRDFQVDAFMVLGRAVAVRRRLRPSPM